MNKSKLIIACISLFLMKSASADDFFSQPEKLCNALTSEGLLTKGWKPSNSVPGEFICMTTLISFGSEGFNGMPSNIAFYVNGTQSNQADDVRIKVNINNPATRKEALQKLRSATAVLFKAINEKLPPKLDKAISNGNPLSFETAFGKAELIREPGNIDSFKMVLTNKQFIARKKQAVATSVSDFEACKSIISRAVGYGASSLKGDGNPTTSEGYKSFFINGKDKDMFFCEVHPQGNYVVRASLGGELPFKIIVNGK
jgi:hypothetical protein